MLTYITATRTHVGLVRKINEDSILARGDVGMWVVADGMGGHEAGDYASRKIVEELAAVPRPEDGRRFLADVQDALTAVNDELWQRAGAIVAHRVIGSTVVVVLAFDGAYACLWAGDSRVYLSRAGVLTQITRDHSLVQQMLDAGAISEEEAKTHPDGNVITRALGASDVLRLDVTSDQLADGDKLLLCSDGLTRMVDEFEIGGHVAGPDIQLAADALLDLCLARGAKDNVSFIIVQVADAAADASHDHDDVTIGTMPSPTLDGALQSLERPPTPALSAAWLASGRTWMVCGEAHWPCRVHSIADYDILVELLCHADVSGDHITLNAEGMPPLAVTRHWQNGSYVNLKAIASPPAEPSSAGPLSVADLW